MIAAIYARVSTDEQARTGYSLQDQAARCREKLSHIGESNIKEYIDDGYSGEFLDRPALDELRSDLRRGMVSCVCVYDPDRLSRNLTNQLLIADELEKADVPLYFVTGDYDASPEGRLFFSIRGAISAFEKAKIRERTLRGKREKARQGKIVLNNHPYGFNWDAENSTYTINEDEAEVVRMMYDLCIKRRIGSAQISGILAESKILNRGKRFNYMAIYRILTKELYCGTAYSRQITTTKTGQRTYKVTKLSKEEWIPIPVPPIVSRETWEEAQKTIKQNSTLSKRNSKRDYFLSGIVKCGICGMGMVASMMTKPNGRVTYYYRCVTRSSPHYSHQKKCRNRYIQVDKVESAVWEAMVNIAKGNTSWDYYLVSRDIPDYSAEIEMLSSKYEQSKKRQADIIKWFRSGLIDADIAEKDLNELNKEINHTSEKLLILKSSQKKIKKAPVISLETILEASTVEKKRKVILDSEIKVFLKREGKEFDFWFEV